VTKKFDAAHGGAAFSSATDFWSSQDNLMKYDVVLMSCEGDTYPEAKPQSSLDTMAAFANAGGRIFASHWHRFWFDTSQGQSMSTQGQTSPFDAFGVWADMDDPPSPINGKVDASFPKGAAFQDWLVNVGASPSPGVLPIKSPQHNIDSVTADKAQQWITIDDQGGAVEYLSFNTPQSASDDQKCGRAVYADIHVSSADQNGPAWPGGCTQTDQSPQEKALEFMLFDLSSCIQPDNAPPAPPPETK
jgi:hypothetical protein